MLERRLEQDVSVVTIESEGGHPWDGKGHYATAHVMSNDPVDYKTACDRFLGFGYHFWIDGTSSQYRHSGFMFKLISDKSPADLEAWR